MFRVKPDKNPRLLIEQMLLGEAGEDLLADDRIWYCSLCYTCTARCPQGVDLAHVLLELKNLAAKLKNVPDAILAEVKAILESGSTAETSQAILSRRKRLGLPELPESNHDEVMKLLDLTGVTESIKRLGTTEAEPEEATT